MGRVCLIKIFPVMLGGRTRCTYIFLKMHIINGLNVYLPASANCLNVGFAFQRAAWITCI